MTLVAAARRYEEAGIAPTSRALESLQRCKAGRPPIYRDGDIYALDPHNEEAGRWAFRLGLRPPKVAAQPIAVPDLRPLPPLDRPPAIAELREAWCEGIPANWSAQRIAICVLDAHAKPMAAGEVLNFVQANGQTNRLSTDSRNAGVRALQFACETTGCGDWMRITTLFGLRGKPSPYAS